MSILKIAGRQETNIKEFIENSAGGSSFKYSAVANAKHIIYIPTTKRIVNEDGVDKEIDSLVAYSLNVHELNMPGDKYRAVPCLHNVIYNNENGDVINDGSCPFCDRVNDAWEIVNYRIALEEQACTLVGDARETYMVELKKDIRSSLKVSSKTPFLYLLIYVYNTDSQGKPVISEATGLPEYTPKVWKLRTSRIEKMQEQVENAGGTLGGSEIAIKYPDTQDARLLVSQSVTTPIFENKQMITLYPGLKEQMQKDAAEFDWEGIENTFSELNDLPSATALKLANDLFKDWDAYQERLKTDPNAVYLEYRRVGNPVPTQEQAQGNVAMPQIGTGTAQASAQIPQAMDANALFGGAKSSLDI